MTNSKQIIRRIGFIILLFFIHLNISAQQDAEYVENQVIIKFKPGVSENTIDNIKANLKANVANKFKIGAELWELSGVSVEEAINTYTNDPIIEYIEPNYIVHAVDVIPNDPSFSQLWGLLNTGQSGGAVDADIDATDAWSINTGETYWLELLIRVSITITRTLLITSGLTQEKYQMTVQIMTGTATSTMLEDGTLPTMTTILWMVMVTVRIVQEPLLLQETTGLV